MIRRPRRQSRRFKPLIQAIIGLSLLGYLAYHAVEGDRGLKAYSDLSERIVEAEAVLAGLRMEKQRLDDRVALLRSDSLDRDMLEERARHVLNYVRTDEIVVSLDRR